MDSLERLVPDTATAHDVDGLGRETLSLHLERYAFAAQHIALYAPKGRSLTVVDAACGVGYGSGLLAERLGPDVVVHGVDLDADSVAYARERYAREETRFHAADALYFRLDRPADAVVSLETLEHVPDPRGLLRHLVSLLSPDGIVVASAPVTPSVDANPYHLHDFTSGSFTALLRSAGLREFSMMRQVQRFDPFALANRTTQRAKTLRRGLLGYYASHPQKAALRAYSTLRFGFANHYLTVAARRR